MIKIFFRFKIAHFSVRFFVQNDESLRFLYPLVREFVFTILRVLIVLFQFIPAFLAAHIIGFTINHNRNGRTYIKFVSIHAYLLNFDFFIFEFCQQQFFTNIISIIVIEGNPGNKSEEEYSTEKEYPINLSVLILRFCASVSFFI